MPITRGLKLAHGHGLPRTEGLCLVRDLHHHLPDQGVAWEMLSTVLRPRSISSPQGKSSQSCEPEAADLV